MNGVKDDLLLLREIDSVVQHLDKDRVNKLRSFRDLVSEEFQKYYNPSNIVLNCIDLLLQAGEANNLEKRDELNSKLKTNVLLINVWKMLIGEDIL